MRSYLLLFLLLAACSGQSNQKEASKIRLQVDSYTKAYNSKDPQAIANHWAENAQYIDTNSGTIIKGRKAIQEYFTTLFSEEGDAQLEVQVESITFPNSDTAIEKGEAKITYKREKPIVTSYRAEHVRRNGEWHILSVSELEQIQPSSQYEHLKPLSWLVGNWIDQDEDVSVVTEYSWDEFKNFLTQKFTVNVYDRKEMEGRQVITWDANKEQVRSWVFDSDGGFGEGKWKHEGDKWFVEVAYTLSDGRRASAVNIYTKLNDDAYQFESHGRMVEGVVLPNVGPVKVVRRGK